MSPSQSAQAGGQSVEKEYLESTPLMAAVGTAQIYEMDAHHRFRFQHDSPRHVSSGPEGLEMASIISTPDKHAMFATECNEPDFKVRVPEYLPPSLAHASHAAPSTHHAGYHSHLSIRLLCDHAPLVTCFHTHTSAYILETLTSDQHAHSTRRKAPRRPALPRPLASLPLTSDAPLALSPSLSQLHLSR